MIIPSQFMTTQITFPCDPYTVVVFQAAVALYIKNAPIEHLDVNPSPDRPILEDRCVMTAIRLWRKADAALREEMDAQTEKQKDEG